MQQVCVRKAKFCFILQIRFTNLICNIIQDPKYHIHPFWVFEKPVFYQAYSGGCLVDHIAPTNLALLPALKISKMPPMI